MSANPRTEALTDSRPVPDAPAGFHQSPPPAAAVERLTYRLEDIARALGVSRRAIEREKSAGRLPKPDRVIGRMPLWRVETIQHWLGGDGR